ncbi:hypothetical protein [Spiroplasma phoeniceum]|uniref:Adhesin P123 n=1 Tax=Spiroplasma phoeniceum P40 TaxID=1276259 RepID=A0A345DLV4_9MOLU|nr:hypothetical protein [Spiroplasma phoeniceum]AXF95192.1 putative adhesin P123 [Spiroplasma phoeniceum P40]
MGGVSSCEERNFKTLNNLSLRSIGLSQTDTVNFNGSLIYDLANIEKNNIKTLFTGYTNNLTKELYENTYEVYGATLLFLLQITALYNKVDNKIKELYIQAWYTSDFKLKIRFTKTVFSELSLSFLNHSSMKFYKYFGNDKNITIDVNCADVLGIRNNSINPISITFIPRN